MIPLNDSDSDILPKPVEARRIFILAPQFGHFILATEPNAFGRLLTFAPSIQNYRD